MTELSEDARRDEEKIEGKFNEEGANGANEAVKVEKKAHRIRDEVFWTELEIRRLSNIVAESIHSKQYVGTGAEAIKERDIMRTYIDAMKRKSMRVLHRAELFVRSGQPSWPGIDSTIGDPVSLAEEYVKVVEDYMGVLSSEEERLRKEREEREGQDAAASPTKDRGADDDWEVADDVAYREALRRERDGDNQSTQTKRVELMGPDAEGLRQRKGVGAAESNGAGSNGTGEDKRYSKEDEEVIARHQPVQDELTNNLVDLVGQLKDSVTENKQILDADKEVVDAVEDAVDSNVDGLAKQQTGLGKFSQSSSTSWWMMLGAVLLIILVFLFVLLLLTVPM